MDDHMFKIVEIVGTSHSGTDAAIQAGISRARETVRNIRWFEVTGVRGFVDDDGAIQYQATMRVGFTLDG